MVRPIDDNWSKDIIKNYITVNLLYGQLFPLKQFCSSHYAQGFYVLQVFLLGICDYIIGLTKIVWNHWYGEILWRNLVWLNTLRQRQNGRDFADNIFKCTFLNENVGISISVSLKFVPKCPIDNIPALVQLMAWRQTGDKPLSETMVAYVGDAYMRHSASMS